jgi:hypothetical protein
MSYAATKVASDLKLNQVAGVVADTSYIEILPLLFWIEADQVNERFLAQNHHLNKRLSDGIAGSRPVEEES